MYVVRAAVMAEPSVILGVNVRHFRMALPVGGNVILSIAGRLLAPDRVGFVQQYATEPYRT